MKKISIIIPVYNSEKYIKRCLDSVKGQTYKNIEIIVIDDGSTDNSGQICDIYEQKDKRFKVFHQKNLGVSAARNFGLGKVTGEYLLFIDSDDWINNDTVELLLNIINNKKTELVMYQICNQKKQLKTKKNREKDSYERMLKKLLINEEINAPFGKLYNTYIIKKNEIKFREDISIAEDLLFNVTYFSKINNFDIIENQCYHYNNDNLLSLSRKYNKEKYNQLMSVNDQIIEIIKLFQNKKLLNAIYYIRVKNIFSCIIDLNRSQCTLSKKEKKNLINQIQENNRIGIIFNCGIKGFIYTCVYNTVRNPKLLLTLVRYYKKIKVRKFFCNLKKLE